VGGEVQETPGQPVESTKELPAASRKSIQPVYAAPFQKDNMRQTAVQQNESPRKQPESTAIPLEDFPLPRYEAPEDRKLVIKPRNWFKMTSRFVVAGIAAVFLLSGFFAWNSYSRASAGLAEAAPSTAILSATNMSPEKLAKEGDARINILLLGIGGEGHTGADLSDTMVLASIDPVNKTASLLSIPRDLWVDMPNEYFGSNQKINAVYSAGKYRYYQQHGKSDEKAAIRAGISAVDGVVEQVLGVPIQYHAVIDFTAFKQAVDAVGGISVDAKTALVDPTMAWENNGNATLAKAGTQQMDGSTALRYVRSRHTSSDFARSTRQREVLVALRKKILTTGTLANPLKIQQLISTFGNNVFTDISTVDLIRLYGIVNTIDEKAITSIDLVSGEHSLVKTDTVGSASVVRPKLGFNRYSDIQTYVRSQLRDGYLMKEQAGVVVAGESQPTADGVKTVLSDLGYTVLSSQVNTSSVVQKTTIVDLSNGLSPYTRHYLDKRFGGNFTESLPKGLIVPDGTQFVILVGK
jgi:LCP family protein required for cell wall assembly